MTHLRVNLMAGKWRQKLQTRRREILELRPDVPWRMFLVEVIPQDSLEEWQRELEPRHRVKIH